MELFKHLCRSYIKHEGRKLAKAVDAPEVSAIEADSDSQDTVPHNTDLADNDLADSNSSSTELSAPEISTSELPVSQVTARKRYIPRAVRRLIYARCGARCAFVGEDGHRCESQWDLEIEHIVPFACGGSNDESNLTLYCRAHNNYRAEQVYGKETMKRKQDKGSRRNHRQSGGDMTNEVGNGKLGTRDILGEISRR
jgi:hypothetical protein